MITFDISWVLDHISKKIIGGGGSLRNHFPISVNKDQSIEQNEILGPMQVKGYLFYRNLGIAYLHLFIKRNKLKKALIYYHIYIMVGLAY